MNYLDIASSINDICKDAELKDYKKHLVAEVEIKGDKGGIFYIEVKDGKISTHPGEYKNRDIRFSAKLENFIALAAGKLDPVKAFLTRKIVVSNIDKAMELKNLAFSIKENNPEVISKFRPEFKKLVERMEAEK